jgi:hypothetical protein
MAQQADKAPTGVRQVQLPSGTALKPPVSIEDLKADTEYDPESAEEFVAFIRATRQGTSQ